jgi:hypothetical protein
MAKAAVTQLERHIEAAHREAYAAGYAAAMQVISDLASRPAPKAGTAPAAPRRRGRGRVRQAALAVKPTPPRCGPRKDRQFGKRTGATRYQRAYNC